MFLRRIRPRRPHWVRYPWNMATRTMVINRTLCHTCTTCQGMRKNMSLAQNVRREHEKTLYWMSDEDGWVLQHQQAVVCLEWFGQHAHMLQYLWQWQHAHSCFTEYSIYTNDSLEWPVSVAQWANALSEPQCLTGWNPGLGMHRFFSWLD